jgi:hypothetical protein
VALSAVENDRASAERRIALCRALGEAFRERGDFLWIKGNLLGPDRALKASPFDFGDDADVGLATVTQIAGELTMGAVALLEQGNLYAAAALIRQLVEIEYLAWAFAEDQEQAKEWLRSTREERLRFWQPRDLRQRSHGRFRSADYATHCERGGHPTPQAMALLPDHSGRDLPMLWWLDLAIHAASTWDYLTDAAPELGRSEQFDPTSDRHSLAQTIQDWRDAEPLLLFIRR